ncbi:Ferric reduction oxidase 2 [Linum perenne]
MSTATPRNETGSVKAMIAARLAIEVLLGFVFLGYIMIWLMSSTNIFYLHWMPRVQAKTNFTFIGAQGQNTLIFTMPIIFIAVMACFYLHLGKKLGHHGIRCSKGETKFARWRKPFLIKGALGIVSWTELSFLLMFIALLSWSVYSYLHAMFAPIRQEAAAQGLKVWELKLSSTGLTLGLVGNICLAFIFFPVTRGSSVLQMIGLTSESSIKYHIWLGHMAMTLFTLHGLCYVVFWAETTRLLEMMKWDDLMVANVAGEVALAAGLLMWATSFTCVRRKFFELFFYTHHLYILFVIFYVFHVGFSSACTILPGIYLFAIDRFLRSLQSQQRVRLVSARVLPCRAVELNFAKSSGLRYNPTSSMFINIPSISKLQWHPFSVTSSSKLETDRISVVIKSEGHWTTKLYQKLSSPSSTTRLDVSVEGPYGPASSEFMRHDTLVLVSGGSGITPFISIIREILCLSNTKGIKTPKVLLICAFKHCADLTILDLLLPVPGSGSTNQTLDISLTELEKERKSEEADEQNQIRTLWFRPNQEDTPVAAALGPNSWIWLGGIISGSFVIYLVLMGLIMEYFVYPIDDNTNQRFSTPAKAALNILSICVAIVASSALGFLWNRRGHGIENVRVVNREMLPPSTNLSEGNGDAETEVESQPGNAIQQATTVHFGKRPNMKRILLDVEGENVGVLASGPKKLRQRVANFCSSSMADNLHFHSISFTW